MYLSEWIYRPNETKLKEMITVSMSINKLWKKHGATDTYLCTLNGSDMGCIATTIAFENAEAFGKSWDAISADPEAGTKLAELASLGGEWVRHNLYRSIGG